MLPAQLVVPASNTLPASTSVLVGVPTNPRTPSSTAVGPGSTVTAENVINSSVGSRNTRRHASTTVAATGHIGGVLAARESSASSEESDSNFSNGNNGSSCSKEDSMDSEVSPHGSASPREGRRKGTSIAYLLYLNDLY